MKVSQSEIGTLHTGFDSERPAEPGWKTLAGPEAEAWGGMVERPHHGYRKRG